MDDLSSGESTAHGATASSAIVASTRRLTLNKRLSCGLSGTGNVLVHGENLAAMSALSDSIKGQVKCAYMDPPYRTGERFAHYDDDATHEVWLRDVQDRVRSLWDLLASDGSLWISINDIELHYLKVAIDNAIGRSSFIATIIWQQRTTRENRNVFSNNHEYLLVYAKDARGFSRTRNRLPLTEVIKGRYANLDNDPRGPWQSVSANVQAGHAVSSQFYVVTAPNGMKHFPPNGRCWVYNQQKMDREIAQGNVWFGKSGNGVPRLKKFLSESRDGLTPETLWFAEQVGTTDHAKKHLRALFPGEVLFDTPKPEALIARILHIGSNPGELVLDPYLGSGTTGAVAMKMGRRFIGIELGEHAATVAATRLRKVVDGESGGVSTQFDWKGGSGFSYMRMR